METYGNKAVWSDRWKLLWDWPSRDWQLYDLFEDPGETRDLSAVYPEQRAEMMQVFADFAESNGVVVLDDEVGYARYPDQVEAFSATPR
jgi:arylsulfatase